MRKHWGNDIWNQIHTKTFLYPDNPSINDINNMISYINSIPNLLPCKRCKLKTENYIKNYKETLEEICLSKKSLINFFFIFHNYVNKRLAKPLFSMEDLYSKYIP